MSVYYKDLPPEIQKRVEELCLNKTIMLETTINGMFYWKGTKEGTVFWSEISVGNFDVFYKLYPKKEYKNAREIRRVLRINRIPLEFTEEQLEMLKINNIDYEI